MSKKYVQTQLCNIQQRSINKLCTIQEEYKPHMELYCPEYLTIFQISRLDSKIKMFFVCKICFSVISYIKINWLPY